MSLINDIVSAIFVGKQSGEEITTFDYPKLKIWKKETIPVLRELERQNYIKIRYTKHNIRFIIRKPITKKVVNSICC